MTLLRVSGYSVAAVAIAVIAALCLQQSSLDRTGDQENEALRALFIEVKGSEGWQWTNDIRDEDGNVVPPRGVLENALRLVGIAVIDRVLEAIGMPPLWFDVRMPLHCYWIGVDCNHLGIVNGL